MKINSLSDIKNEKKMLKQEAAFIVASLENDVEKVKKAIRPAALLYRAASKIIPEALKSSKITGAPISFLLKTLFGNHQKEEPKTEPNPAAEKQARIKNVALNIAETAAMFFLKRDMNRRKQ